MHDQRTIRAAATGTERCFPTSRLHSGTSVRKDAPPLAQPLHGLEDQLERRLPVPHALGGVGIVALGWWKQHDILDQACCQENISSLGGTGWLKSM